MATTSLVAGVLFGAPACRSPQQTPRTAPAETGPTRVTADWDDVPASVAAAAERSELAVLDSERPDERTVVFHLIGVRDESAEVTVRRLGEGLEMTELQVEARVGLNGDEGRSTRLRRDIADRLEQLAGVDFSPIRW